MPKNILWIIFFVCPWTFATPYDDISKGIARNYQLNHQVKQDLNEKLYNRYVGRVEQNINVYLTNEVVDQIFQTGNWADLAAALAIGYQAKVEKPSVKGEQLLQRLNALTVESDRELDSTKSVCRHVAQFLSGQALSGYRIIDCPERNSSKLFLRGGW